MDFFNIFLIALALSMDAFAVSVTNGITQVNSRFKHALITALSFGFFQGLMPFLGWLAGVRLYKIIQAVDHWIVFGLLVFVGVRMIIEAFEKDKISPVSLGLKILLITSIATSIDALAVGVSFAFSGMNAFTKILTAAGMIALVTSVICLFGFYIGRKFGAKYKKTAEIIGGVVLIGIGLKVLLEHLLG